MTQIHKPVYFAQATTWEIQGNLSYADGSPFDLATPGASVQWKVEDSSGNIIVQASSGGGTITFTGVPGQCLIILPAAATNKAVGSYADQLQATDSTGYTSLQWSGQFSVTKSFFV
jgi:hypothetical protein